MWNSFSSLSSSYIVYQLFLSPIPIPIPIPAANSILILILLWFCNIAKKEREDKSNGSINRTYTVERREKQSKKETINKDDDDNDDDWKKSSTKSARYENMELFATVSAPNYRWL